MSLKNFKTRNGIDVDSYTVPSTIIQQTIKTNSATTLDTFDMSLFNSIEYLITIKQGSKIRTSKVLMQTDGSSVDMTEFGITETGGTISGVAVTASTASTNAILQITITDAATTIARVRAVKNLSSPFVPVAPDAPTIGTATQSAGVASISFTAPYDNGGSSVTSYIATSNTGNLTGTSSSSPISVSGLAPGISYTFTVKATNSIGTSVESLSSNSISLPAIIVDYLVLAGGGPGGLSGGGGAGGLRSTVGATGGGGSLESAVQFASNQTYTITVGAGGPGYTGTGTRGSNGVDSSIIGGVLSLTSIGGGAGGGDFPAPNATGANGGSGGGGGGGYYGANQSGGRGTAGQGYDGGAFSMDNYLGGGGGGAGARGEDGQSYTRGGNGGAGISSSITGSSVTYAGGGGGGVWWVETPGSGGSGIGGSGTRYGVSGSGVVNTGSGGGGSDVNGSGNYTGTTGSGGSGVVILRTISTASATTGSPTITTSGSYNIYKFTSSGSIRF
jgi:hypothetical protein